MATNEEIIQECKSDLIIFGKMISPKTYYLPSPEFHYEMAELINDRKITQLVIQAPRGFGKSSLCNSFVLHHCLFDPGDKVVVIQSKTRPEAINRLGKIKNILNYSRNFISLFGYWGEDARTTTMWREDKIQFKLRSPETGEMFNVNIKAIGTGQPARGMLESGIEQLADGSWDIGDDTRITLYYLDDPDDEDNTRTVDAMDNNFKKFVGSKEGLDSRTGRVIAIGTLIRAGCIIHKLLTMAGWIKRSYRNDLAKGIFLWPELRDAKWLQGKKDELASVYKLSLYYSEYEGTLTGDDEQIFKEEDLQWYDGYLETEGEESYLHITHKGRILTDDGAWILKELNEEILLPVNTYIGVDPASSRKPGADFSVTMPIAFDEFKNVYVLPYFEKRVRPTDHAKQIIDKFLELRPQKTYIETTAYQESLKSMLEDWEEEHDEYIPGLNRVWKPRVEKDDRLKDLERFTRSRKLHLTPKMNTLFDELIQFPRGRKNLLDGLWYATRHLNPPEHHYRTPEQREQDDIKYFLRQQNSSRGWLRA